MKTSIAALAVSLAAVSGLVVGCDRSTPAPTQVGVCWHAVPQKNGSMKFNELSEHVDSIEKCAAALEAMRLKFLGLGGSANEITGAYQGRYLFLQSDGIFASDGLNKGRYPLLVRTGDGRLANPSAMPQQ